MNENQKTSVNKNFVNRFKRVPISEDLEKLIKAIYALMPSRNRVSQLIMLLPLKEEELQELAPEFSEDIEYWDMFKATLGLSRYSSGEMYAEYGTLSRAIKEFIDKLFEIFRDEKMRLAISSLIGELVPNPEREWLEVRVRAVLKNTSISNTVKKVLMLLTEVSQVNIKELPSRLGIDEREINQCIYVLKNLKLVNVNGDTLSLSSDVARYIPYIKKLLGEVER